MEWYPTGDWLANCTSVYLIIGFFIELPSFTETSYAYIDVSDSSLWRFVTFRACKLMLKIKASQFAFWLCRESLLTKLMMESLGGNSLALMIACVSPSSSALDETLSTLHYGTCAKHIINAPSVNMDARDKVRV